MVPHILLDDPTYTASTIKQLSADHLDAELKLRDYITSLPLTNKYSFSTLSSLDFMNYLFACLSYSKVDTELVNIPPFREKLVSGISKVLSELSLQDHSLVCFSEPIEKKIYEILDI